MAPTAEPASSPPLPPPRRWRSCESGAYPFPYCTPPSTNSFYPPPPPPPPAPVLPTPSNSPTSAIVHPLLIAIIPSFAFALALGLYYVLAARLCPNRGFFFFSGLLSPGHRRRFRRSPDNGGGGGQSSFFAWPAHVAARGLDESLIALIPVCTYAGAEQGLVGGSECAVCLGEFRHGEVLRLLPKCSHAFHLTCVDKWLRAHTTCPMCRANVVNFNFANATMAMAATPNPSPPPTLMPPDSTVPTPETTMEPQLHGASVSMKRSFSEGLLLQNPALAMAMVRTNTNNNIATATTTTTIPSTNPPSASSSHCLHRVLDKSRSFDMSSAKGKHTDTRHPLDNPSMKRPLLGSRVFSDENPTDISTMTPSSSPSNHNHRINPGESLLGSYKDSDKNTADASSTSNVWHLVPGNASMTKPLLGSRVFSDEDSPTSSSPSDYPPRDLDKSLLGSRATLGKNMTTDTSTSSSGHGYSSR